MQYHQPLPPSLDSEFRALVVQQPIARLAEKAATGLALCRTLGEIEAFRFTNREELEARAATILNASPELRRQAELLDIPEGQRKEFVMQKLAGGFFIVDRFVAFSARTSAADESFLTDRLARAMTPDRIDFLAHLSEVSPLGAALLTSMWAGREHSCGTASATTEAAKKSIDDQFTALESAVDAVLQLKNFFGAMQRQMPASDATSSILSAWNQDLARPVLEAATYAIALAMTPAETGIGAGATWFAPYFPVPTDRKLTGPFVADLRDYCKTEAVPGRMLRYLGYNLAEQESRQEMRNQSELPIPILVGAADAGTFLSWARHSFRRLNEAVAVGAPFKRAIFRNGANFHYPDGIEIFLRPREDAHGQARAGITFLGESGPLSIRIDRESDGIALDIGNIDGSEFLASARSIHSAHRKLITHYRRTRSELNSAHPESFELSGKKAELFKTSERISMFENAAMVTPAQIARFSAAMSGLGRLLGTRGEQSVGHHTRESLFRISSVDFQRFIRDLTVTLQK